MVLARGVQRYAGGENCSLTRQAMRDNNLRSQALTSGTLQAREPPRRIMLSVCFVGLLEGFIPVPVKFVPILAPFVPNRWPSAENSGKMSSASIEL